MTSLRRILTGITLAIAASGLASATSVIGYETSFPASGVQNTDFNYTLTLPKFNIAGQNLLSATIYFFSYVQVPDLDLQNVSSSPETFTYTFQTNATNGMANSAVASDKYGTEDLINFNSGSITLGPGFGTGATPSCGPAPNLPSATCSDVFYAPPIMSDSNVLEGLGTVGTGVSGLVGIVRNSGNPGGYVGAGTFTLTGATQSFTGFSGGGGNITINQTTQAMIEAEIDYTYAPSGAPEPTTMVLFGSALVGLGLLRKRVRG